MSLLTYDDVRNAANLDLGTSRWISVDQKRVNGFADLSEDHQWIHIDPERASLTGEGATIAHGYLTVTLVGTLVGELLRLAPGLVMVNYGLDALRLVAPVKTGSRLRAAALVRDVGEVPSGLRVTIGVTGEVDGNERPACVATLLILVRREHVSVADEPA